MKNPQDNQSLSEDALNESTESQRQPWDTDPFIFHCPVPPPPNHPSLNSVAVTSWCSSSLLSTAYFPLLTVGMHNVVWLDDDTMSHGSDSIQEFSGHVGRETPRREKSRSVSVVIGVI